MSLKEVYNQRRCLGPASIDPLTTASILHRTGQHILPSHMQLKLQGNCCLPRIGNHQSENPHPQPRRLHRQALPLVAMRTFVAQANDTCLDDVEEYANFTLAQFHTCSSNLKTSDDVHCAKYQLYIRIHCTAGGRSYIVVKPSQSHPQSCPWRCQ